MVLQTTIKIHYIHIAFNGLLFMEMCSMWQLLQRPCVSQLNDFDYELAAYHTWWKKKKLTASQVIDFHYVLYTGKYTGI